VLAQARDRYLPGMSDEQIIERLDRLATRLGGRVLGHGGRLDYQAGRILVAEIGLEAHERASAAIDAALQQFDGVQAVAEPLREAQRTFNTLRAFYEAECKDKL
jgi:class 3 adenylate cyclase